MIEIKSLKLRLGTKLIFNDFNFKAEKGEKIGIIGGEGVGKTTLLDVISGREFPDSGKINISGSLININQNVYTNLSEMGVAAMTKAERFKSMMTKILSDEKNEDRILLLDEPTKNLDNDETEWLIKLLNDAKNLTVTVASNDRYFLKKVCNRTVTLGETDVDEIILPTVEIKDDSEEVLIVEDLRKIVDGETVFKKVSFSVEAGQKIALVGKNKIGKTKLLKALGAGIEVQGEIKFSDSVKIAYMPRVFSSAAAKSELEKLCESDANFLILDNATACLDLLTIVEFESALKNFCGTVIFADSDHEFIQAIANRIIDLTPDGTVDRISNYEEFLSNETVKAQIFEKYKK